MQYLGGKSRIAKKIAAHLEALARPGALIEDRFCGGLSVAAAIKHRPLRVADANAALVCTLRAVQDGWVPPESLSEAEYATLKARRDPADPLTAFAAAGCSFGAKWWGGYARNAKGDNFAGRARRSLLSKMARLQGAEITCSDYKLPTPVAGSVVYCDPPYANSVGYPECGDFDSEEFWRVAEAWARSGVVVRVSEYAAPAGGWVVVESYGDVQVLGRSRGAEKIRADYLWKHEDGL